MQSQPTLTLLQTAYWGALLLGGCSQIAETAVSDGIDKCQELSRLNLLIETCKSVVRQRRNGASPFELPSTSSSELKRISKITHLSRDCVVLRLLLSLPSEDCATILNLSAQEFGEALAAALIELPNSVISDTPVAYEHARRFGPDC